jgi:hypothetical protein
MQWVPLLNLVQCSCGIPGCETKCASLAPQLTIQRRAGGVYLSLTESEHHRSVSKREAVTVR